MNNTNPGKIFEQEIKSSIPKNIFYMRIKDPAQSFGSQNGNTRFQLHNGFDGLIFTGKKLFCCELKQNQSTSIQFSLEDNKHNIKKCQIESLMECVKYENVVGGFLLNFRKYEVTYWIDIQTLMKFIEGTTKKQINTKDLSNLGAYIVPQRRLKVRYKYDLTELLGVETKEENGKD